MEENPVVESKPIAQITIVDCGELKGDSKLRAEQATTKGQTKIHNFNDMIDMPDQELEDFTMSHDLKDYGKFSLCNWVKQAVKNGNEAASAEYQTYWSIRFDKAPELDSIISNLNDSIKTNQSPRACNTLGELYHASAGGNPNTNSPEWKEAASLAAKYYMLSAEQEDIVGLHWTGVFLHEGFGISKDVNKAIEFLTKAANAGNGRSMYQLYLLHSGNEGYDLSLKKAENAYIYLLRSLSYGVNGFDECAKYFNENY